MGAAPAGGGKEEGWLSPCSPELNLPDLSKVSQSILKKFHQLFREKQTWLKTIFDNQINNSLKKGMAQNFHLLAVILFPPTISTSF